MATGVVILPLLRLKDSLRSGNLRRVFNRWGVRYLSFAQERFDKYSKGGGDWTPLKKSTIDRRRSGTKRSKSSGLPKTTILRDTGVLLNTLDFRTKVRGQLREDLPNGIRVGFGGPARHGSGGIATIADIASFHDSGAGHLPKRTIIAQPDQITIKQMVDDLVDGALREYK